MRFMEIVDMTIRATGFLIFFFNQRATPSKNTCATVKSTEINIGRYHIQGNAEMISQDTWKG